MVAVAYTGTPQLALLGFRGLGLRVWGLGPSNSLFLGAYSKPPPKSWMLGFPVHLNTLKD